MIHYHFLHVRQKTSWEGGVISYHLDSATCQKMTWRMLSLAVEHGQPPASVPVLVCGCPPPSQSNTRPSSATSTILPTVRFAPMAFAVSLRMEFPSSGALTRFPLADDACARTTLWRGQLLHLVFTNGAWTMKRATTRYGSTCRLRIVVAHETLRSTLQEKEVDVGVWRTVFAGETRRHSASETTHVCGAHVPGLLNRNIFIYIYIYIHVFKTAVSENYTCLTK